MKSLVAVLLLMNPVGEAANLRATVSSAAPSLSQQQASEIVDAAIQIVLQPENEATFKAAAEKAGLKDKVASAKRVSVSMPLLKNMMSDKLQLYGISGDNAMDSASKQITEMSKDDKTLGLKMARFARILSKGCDC